MTDSRDEHVSGCNGEYVSSGADISADGRYRYKLWREWRGTHDPKNWRWLGAKDGADEDLGEPKSCLFVMLNPSTADSTVDDPTIRRCVGFAKSWNYERLEVVNLFAVRTSSPRTLKAMHYREDPVGVRNEEAFDHAVVRAGLIVCAWGSHGSHMGQDETVLGWLPPKSKLFALGFTGSGHPRHPLYLRSDTQLESMKQDFVRQPQ